MDLRNLHYTLSPLLLRYVIMLVVNETELTRLTWWRGWPRRDGWRAHRQGGCSPSATHRSSRGSRLRSPSRWVGPRPARWHVSLTSSLDTPRHKPRTARPWTPSWPRRCWCGCQYSGRGRTMPPERYAAVFERYIHQVMLRDALLADTLIWTKDQPGWMFFFAFHCSKNLMLT